MLYFLAKTTDNDRDAVKYIEFAGFECGHYFGGLRVCGPCFSGFEEELRKTVNNDFESLKTILTKEEFLKLFDLNDQLRTLGYNIEEGSDTYNKGMAIIKEYEDTIGKKLASEENEKFFGEIVKEEKEYLKDTYGLTDEDIDIIYENYKLEYKDSAIVSMVYDDLDELIEDEKFELGYDKQPYFDDEAFGKDLLEDEFFHELTNGKIVRYSY